MRNTSKIQITIRGMFACLGVIAACWSTYSRADNPTCGSEQQRRKASSIGEVKAKACLGPSEAVWLIKRNNKQQYEIFAPTLQARPVLFGKTANNLDPALVGGEQNVRFLIDRIVDVDDIDFLPGLFAYRSQADNAAGVCGAGMEVFLIPLRIENKKIQRQKPLLIESCLKDIYLDSDGPDKWTALSVIGGKVMIRWQSYSGRTGPVNGEFDMRSGSLTVNETK